MAVYEQTIRRKMLERQEARITELEAAMRDAIASLGPLGDCCGLGPCSRKRRDRDDSCKLHDARRALVNALHTR